MRKRISKLCAILHGLCRAPAPGGRWPPQPRTQFVAVMRAALTGGAPEVVFHLDRYAGGAGILDEVKRGDSALILVSLW